MLSKIRAYIFAYRTARRHVKNWHKLLLFAFLKLDGVFRDRYGGLTTRTDALNLLKKLVKCENQWVEELSTSTITFSGELMEVPVLDGSFKLKIPINGKFNFGPKRLVRLGEEYGLVDVKDKVILDVGAYLGDTAIYWIYKGAKKVYAVEPVPEHYELLCLNTKGLPVVTILGSVGCKVPKIPELVGSGKYGEASLLRLSNRGDPSDYLDVPQYSLLELVKEYDPNIIKVDCEGCEHYILSEIVACKGRTIIVELHDTHKFRKEDSLAWLEKHLGKATVTHRMSHIVTVIWQF